MKSFPFAALLAIFFAFLSCSTNEGGYSSPRCKIAAKGYAVPDHIKELDSYNELDPSCKSEQKKLVVFYDFFPKEIDWDYVYSHLPGYVPGSGNSVGEYGGANSLGDVYYVVNGIEMTEEKYETYKAEYWRKYGEELDKSGRDLDIQCVIDGNLALLTDKEITELKEKYDYLAIEDYTEAVPMTDGENGAIPPPCGK